MHRLDARGLILILFCITLLFSLNYTASIEPGDTCLLGVSDCAFKSPGPYPLCDDCSNYVLCGSPPAFRQETSPGISGRPVGTLMTCEEGLLYDPRVQSCTQGDDVICGTTSKSPEKRRLLQSSAVTPTTTTTTTAHQDLETVQMTFPNVTPPPLPPNALPTMENATTSCSTATFVCDAGNVWVGHLPQSVFYDVTTMTWGTPMGLCQLIDTTDPVPNATFPVPHPDNRPFGICLDLQPSAANDSNIVVSLLMSGDALLRFSLNFSCNSSVLSSVIGGEELYHIYLNHDLSRFLDVGSTFSLNILQVAPLEYEYEITDGQVTFSGTVEEWPNSSLSLRRVDTLTITGDVKVINVNTQCVP